MSIIMTRQEFAELIERDGKAVYSFCSHLTGNRDETDELYQETMLKAMECHERIDDELGSPRSFLMGIAAKSWKNRKRMFARRQRIAPREYVENEDFYRELTDGEPTPEEAYISQEMCRLVRMETAKLKDKYRIPIYLYYSAGLTIEEIAASLDIPKGTVKSRLHTARTIIGKRMEEHGYEG